MMVKTRFLNSYRNPITGEAMGVHSAPLTWISRLGLTDGDGLPFHQRHIGDVYAKYGPGSVSPEQNITLVSNSGDHDYDQAATYLGQQAIQQGRMWFPNLGAVLPPEQAKQAAMELRNQLEGKQGKWEKQSDVYDPTQEPNWMANGPEYDDDTCPKCGRHGCKVHNQQAQTDMNPIWKGWEATEPDSVAISRWQWESNNR